MFDDRQTKAEIIAAASVQNDRLIEALLRVQELERGDKLQKRPVAWRLKDFADGWIIFQDEAKAVREAEQMGGLGIMQGLYVRDGT
jgi:hypothetical protein